jgi:hypothetical protein
MTTAEHPHRRDFASRYTTFLRQRGCVDTQLVRYDTPAEPINCAGASTPGVPAPTAEGGHDAS